MINKSVLLDRQQLSYSCTGKLPGVLANQAQFSCKMRHLGYAS